MSRGKCPHERIQYCPLYVGMHISGGPSCWPKNGSDPMDKGCAVEQGLTRCGIRVAELGTEEVVELFYKIFNPGETEKPIKLT